ncbi:MAG: hypothetical protein M1396_04510 [Chloroflexi bacterium]|nr:hypothetical protein [Chloroflexota bacterium]MCL5946728.1 hypothetical protein [Chloroflexota bacterium]
MTWQTIVSYLFTTPGSEFSYYAPFLMLIVGALLLPIQHFILEGRRRLQNYRPVQELLDRVASMSAAAAILALLLVVARHANLPVISWRLWLYLYVVVVAVAFVLTLRFVYSTLLRGLAARDNELLRHRYLASPNQRQVLHAQERRRSASRRH